MGIERVIKMSYKIGDKIEIKKESENSITEKTFYDILSALKSNKLKIKGRPLVARCYMLIFVIKGNSRPASK